MTQQKAYSYVSPLFTTLLSVHKSLTYVVAPEQGLN